jgi:hypothetical protein
MTVKDVVDQFLAAPVDSAESLLGGMRGARCQSRCASPLSGWSKPPVVAISEPGGPVDELSSGGLHLVVEVVEHDNGTLRMAGEEISGGGAHGGGFGAATVARVGG